MNAGITDPETVHLDDGDLIRLTDGECGPDERIRLERHLAACRPCADRRAELARMSAAVTEALQAADAPRPARVRRSVGLRAAAVLLLVSVAVASAQPVRTWLSARWTQLRGQPPSRVVPQPPDAGATTVRFVPAAAAFTIQVVAPQASGVLTVELTGDTVAAATLSADARDEELIVRPDGLRIVNQPGSRASYTVRLPRRVTRVAVKVGDAVERSFAATPDVRRWTIQLNAPEL